jgi:hypothetical protein
VARSVLVETEGERLTRRDAAISKRQKEESETSHLRSLYRANQEANVGSRELLAWFGRSLETRRGKRQAKRDMYFVLLYYTAL